MSHRRALLVAPVVALLWAAPAQASNVLERYAHDTWASMAAMTDARSGLPADSLNADGTTSVQTSTTNIGAYMWSALVAQRLGIISHRETVARLTKTIGTLEGMERHAPSGQFYNWYDHGTGAKLTVWPPTGDPLTPILSSVDNGWLATGLRLVARSVPELSHRAQALYDSMDFGFSTGPRSTASPSTSHRTPASRRAATTRWSARAGSPATSGSPRASCRRRSTTGRGAASPTRATGAGRRRSRSASRGPTSA